MRLEFDIWTLNERFKLHFLYLVENPFELRNNSYYIGLHQEPGIETLYQFN